MVRATILPSPTPVYKKKGPCTAVQVTVSKQLKLRKRSLWSDGAGEVASKFVKKCLSAIVQLMQVSSIKRV